MLGKCALYSSIPEQREFIHLALTEPNTKHRERQWRKIGYFTINDTTQENGKLMFKSPNSLIQGLGQVYKFIVETGMWKHWWSKLALEDPGAWVFMVTGDIRTGSS